MPTLTDTGNWLRSRLPELIAEHDVPGAAVAVSVGEELVEAAAGLLSTATGVEATVDSVFQVGSITKVWTATLVLQLVDEGLVDLDQPVRTYLPELVLADEEAAAAITVRQLLSHTAGFEGDIFTDTGWGDDCVEKFVATLHDDPQLFAPGRLFSYNNAGYVVLGRLVEKLRGATYDACLREHLFTPLRLSAANGPWEAILQRAAVGHIQLTADAAFTPAPVWSLARSNAPAGSMLAMCPRDLLAFARMHLSDGKGPDGTVVLHQATVKAMQERQVELPDLAVMGNAWGLGWELFDWPGGAVIGHDGGTIGQAAFLRVVPDRGVSVALLTNGGNAIPVYREIVGRVLRELAEVELPALPEPVDPPPKVDATRYVGTYSSSVADTIVTQDDDGRVWVERVVKGFLAELGENPEKSELVGWRDDSLLPAEADHGVRIPHVFLGSDAKGRAEYLFVGRADPRTGSPTEERTR